MTTPPEVKIVKIATHYEVLLIGNFTLYGEGATPELAFKNMMLKVLDYRLKNNRDPLENTTSLSSGRFSVRLDNKLHQLLILEAQRKGLSLNSLIIQKLSKDLEPLTIERHWSLHSIEATAAPTPPHFDFHLFFSPIGTNQHEQKVIIFNNINIADTLGNQCGYPPADGSFSKNKTALSKYIKDTPSIIAACERFLNNPEVRMTGKDTYRCYLLRIKGDDEKQTVHDALRQHLASIDYPEDISATDLLARFDEFMVFEA